MGIGQGIPAKPTCLQGSAPRAVMESLGPSGVPGQEREVGVQGVLKSREEDKGHRPPQPSGHRLTPSGPVLPGWCPMVWPWPCQEVSPH